MTDEDLYTIIDSCGVRDDGRGIAPIPVTIHGGDYTYRGWIIGVGIKRNGLIRAMVEDETGRVMVHTARQVELRHDG